MAVLFHIDSDGASTRPVYRAAHRRSERRESQDGIWKCPQVGWDLDSPGLPCLLPRTVRGIQLKVSETDLFPAGMTVRAQSQPPLLCVGLVSALCRLGQCCRGESLLFSLFIDRNVFK